MCSIEYCVIDKNQIINLHSEYYCREEAFHGLLTCLDNSLNILVNNNIKISIENLTLDNYECIEYTHNLI